MPSKQILLVVAVALVTLMAADKLRTLPVVSKLPQF
jgi:hypothetical protein